MKYHHTCILNQIPNATSKTFLNNSKPTECRLISFKPWLNKCVRHSIFEFKRSAWFHVRAFAFCLMVPPDEKVTKKKAENNLFQFCFALRKCFVFVNCRHFTTSEWLKVLKLSKICLWSWSKPWRQKQPIRTFCFSMNGYHSIYTVDLTSGIKLLILINNYLWINLVSTRHLRPWYAKNMPRCLWTIPVRKLDGTCIYRAQFCTSLA